LALPQGLENRTYPGVDAGFQAILNYSALFGRLDVLRSTPKGPLISGGDGAGVLTQHYPLCGLSARTSH